MDILLFLLRKELHLEEEIKVQSKRKTFWKINFSILHN